MHSEITLKDPFGQAIYNTILKNDYRYNLEIGSWDGSGSTSCFVEAMSKLDGERELTCIEVDKDKFKILKNRYKEYKWIKLYNVSSICKEHLIDNDFETLWNSPYNKIPYQKTTVKTWFDHDVENLPKQSDHNKYYDFCGLYVFDAVLIDGGEFFGYSEFCLLKDRTKCFLLDDVHYAFKCNQVYHELKNDSQWKLIEENEKCRNGYAIFQRI